jgi:hypothetical protein
MGALKYFVNLSAGSPLRGFMASATSQAPEAIKEFVRSDIKDLQLHLLDAPGRYTSEDPTSWLSTKFGVGAKDSAVNSGTFIFTEAAASQSTGALSVGISAAALQAAIRAACTTNLSTCTVTGDDGGPWILDKVSVTDLANPSANTAAVSPSGSVLVVTKTEDGDASLSPKWELALVGPAAALVDSWTALPGVTVTPSVVVAGSASQNKIFDVEWNADSIGGMVTVTFTGDTTTQGVSWPYNATSDDIVTAFETHPDVEDDGVKVETQPGSGYASIECTGTGIALSNTPTLADSGASTLQVPVGLQGTIQYNRAGIISLLASGEPAETTTELEIRRDSGNCETFQGTCKLYKDLLRNIAGVSSPLQVFLTAGEIADDEGPTAIDASPASTLISSSVNRMLTNRTYAVGADVAPYPHVIVLELDPEPAIDGAMALIELQMPASENPTIEIRNATTGGTLLYTALGSGTATNRPLFFTYRASTGAWVSRQGAS